MAERISALSSGFCLDILSGAVALPSDPDALKALLRGYDLDFGIPAAADRALRPVSMLYSRATLASATASDGAFIVALGGEMGTSCRIIVWQAPGGALFTIPILATLRAPERGWQGLPPPPRQPGALRLGFYRRDAKGAAYLANFSIDDTLPAVRLGVTVMPSPADFPLPPAK